MNVEELSNILNDPDIFYLGHGTGRRTDTQNVLNSIMEKGLRCSHGSLTYTTVGLFNGGNLSEHILETLNNWPHLDSNKIVIVGIPYKYQVLCDDRFLSFYYKPSETDREYLRPEFIVGYFDAETQSFVNNPKYFKNQSLSDQEKLINSVKERLYKFISNSELYESYEAYEEMLSDVGWQLPLTSDDKEKFGESDYEIGKVESADAYLNTIAEREHSNDIMNQKDFNNEVDELFSSIVDKINPYLLSEKVKLPNGVSISYRQYLQEFALPYFSNKENVTLANGVTISLVQFLEENIFYECQEKYNGNLEKYLNEKTIGIIDNEKIANQDGQEQTNDSPEFADQLLNELDDRREHYAKYVVVDEENHIYYQIFENDGMLRFVIKKNIYKDGEKVSTNRTQIETLAQANEFFNKIKRTDYSAVNFLLSKDTRLAALYAKLNLIEYNNDENIRSSKNFFENLITEISQKKYADYAFRDDFNNVIYQIYGTDDNAKFMIKRINPDNPNDLIEVENDNQLKDFFLKIMEVDYDGYINLISTNDYMASIVSGLGLEHDAPIAANSSSDRGNDFYDEIIDSVINSSHIYLKNLFSNYGYDYYSGFCSNPNQTMNELNFENNTDDFCYSFTHEYMSKLINDYIYDVREAGYNEELIKDAENKLIKSFDDLLKQAMKNSTDLFIEPPEGVYADSDSCVFAIFKQFTDKVDNDLDMIIETVRKKNLNEQENDLNKMENVSQASLT